MGTSSADRLPSIAVLGAGSMGGAIVRGAVASGVAMAGDIVVTNRTVDKARSYAGLPGVRSVALADEPAGNIDAARDAGIVLIGVKPVMVADLLREIAPALRPETVVVSLAAGITLASMAEILPAGQPVMRAMPNTPSAVRKGVTGLASADTVHAGVAAQVAALFQTVGAVVEIPESQIDAVSAISGSGPAYVFQLIEDLTVAAVGKGFSGEQARLLAEQTFIGAAALLEASGEEPRELRRQVTSPAGTTERAIAVLQAARLPELFAEATDAAVARSRELAAGS